MSQFQQDPYGGPQDQFGDQPRKTSGMAITALICSLIFCCPLTTILGILLGLISFVTIGSNPMKKGRGLAVTAVILGLLFTIGQGGAMYWGKVNFGDIQQAGPKAPLLAASAGNYNDFRTGMYGSASQASDEEIEAFITELESRYGAFQNSYLDEAEFATNPPTMDEMMQPEQTWPYVFEFANATVDGEATYAAADPQSGTFLGRYKFGAITIFDDDLGDITFPPGATVGNGAGNGTNGGNGDGDMNGDADAAEDGEATDAEDAGGDGG